MRFRLDPKKPVDRKDWHRWFAWRPVRIDLELVWLELVERKGERFEDSCGDYWVYDYRTIVGV